MIRKFLKVLMEVALWEWNHTVTEFLRAFPEYRTPSKYRKLDEAVKRLACDPECAALSDAELLELAKALTDARIKY